jgi:hypothetical protein
MALLEETAVEAPEAGAGLPSEEAPVAPQPTAEERLAALEADLQRTRQENETLNERYRQTHAWGNEANIRAAAAERLLSGFRPQQPDNEPQLPEAPTEPDLTQEERERLLDDPALLWNKMREVAAYSRNVADYAARYTYGAVEKRYGGALAMAGRLNALSEPMLEQLSGISVERARTHAKQTLGLDDAEFDRSLEPAWQAMWTAARGDKTAFDLMTLNPKAITMAITMVRSDNGVPVQRQTPPPTIGQGDRRRAPEVPARSSDVESMEKTFGVKFSDEDLARLKDRTKELARERPLRA